MVMILKHGWTRTTMEGCLLIPWKESYDQTRQHSKKQRHYFVNKGLYSQGYGFSSSHVMDVRVGLWRKLSTEELMLLNCGVGECSWESLGQQGSSLSILKEINPEYSMVGLMLKLKTPIFCPPDAKNWLIGKDPVAGKDWRQKEKGLAEEEMVR